MRVLNLNDEEGEALIIMCDSITAINDAVITKNVEPPTGLVSRKITNVVIAKIRKKVMAARYE